MLSVVVELALACIIPYFVQHQSSFLDLQSPATLVPLNLCTKH
jgi:hypothetical protein